MGWAAIIPAALSVASTLMKAKGTADSSAAAAKAASYRGQVAKNNAIINRQLGEYSVESGEARSTLESLRGADLQGRIKANQGASGVAVNSGSSVSVRAGARQASKLNADTVLSNAQLLNYGYQAKAANNDAEAGLAEMEAGADTQAGDIGIMGTLLGGASQLPLKWGGGDSSASTGSSGSSSGTGPSGYSGTEAYSGGDYGSSV